VNGHTVLPSTPTSLETVTLHSGTMLPPGTLLANRFTIISQLGKGAQACVYQAHDELLDTTVAIKLLPGAVAAPLSMQTLRNEVLISRSLQHPNIIRVHDVYCDGQDAFFTMTYIPGELLAQRLSGGVSAVLYRRWEAQLAQAVMACQSAGILHGDIKPDNLLVTENEDLLLIDFGIGRSLHTAGQTSGHPRYSAPEVIATGRPHPQSDTFSAGRVLQDILQAVSTPHDSAAHRFWRWRTRRRVNQLCAVQPTRRPVLGRWVDNPPGFLPPPRFWTITTTLALLTCLTLWLALQPSSPRDDLTPTTRQVALIHADGYPLLRTVAKLLRYPLSLHPDIALIDAQHTDTLITNMALNPLANAQDRVDVASTLGADLVITLELTPANTGLYLVHATATAMPGNEEIFTVSHQVASATLANGLQSFADTLTRTLFAKLDTPITLPEMRFAEPLTDSDEALVMPSHSPQALLFSAQQAADSGDIVDARNTLAALRELPGLHQFWALKANLLNAQLDDNLPLAVQSIGALIRAFPERPELLVAQAKVNVWANQPQAAMKNYQQALTLRPNDGYLWFALARLQIMQGDITEALDNTLTRALVTFRRVNDKQGESLILNAFGIGHLRLAQYDEAMRYFTDALTLRQAESQPDERAKTLANMAIVASIRGQFRLAENSLQEALTLVESQHNAPEQAHILDTLGFLYEEQGLYTQALVYYQQGLDLRLNVADTSLQAESMSNVAYMHFLTGDIALAQIYWQQALTLFTQNNDMSHQLRTRQHLVQLGLIKGDIGSVSRQLRELTNIITSPFEQEQLYQHLLLSYYHFANGKVTQALRHAEGAQSLAKKTNDPKAWVESNLWMAEVCLKTAAWQCAENRLNSIAADMGNGSYEQRAVYRWLKLALAYHQGERIHEQHTEYLSLIAIEHLPRITELKILLDMQERFNLPADSYAIQRATVLNDAAFYETHLQWLYLQARHANAYAKPQLKQVLARYPEYWRNHIYYAVIPDSKPLKDTLQAIWLATLPELQSNNYTEAYIE